MSILNLTQRETQIASLISQDLCAKEIAQRLKVSTWTIKNHTSTIIKKLGVNSRTGIAVKIILSEKERNNADSTRNNQQSQ